MYASEAVYSLSYNSKILCIVSKISGHRKLARQFLFSELSSRIYGKLVRQPICPPISSCKNNTRAQACCLPSHCCLPLLWAKRHTIPMYVLNCPLQMSDSMELICSNGPLKISSIFTNAIDFIVTSLHDGPAWSFSFIM